MALSLTEHNIVFLKRKENSVQLTDTYAHLLNRFFKDMLMVVSNNGQQDLSMYGCIMSKYHAVG